MAALPTEEIDRRAAALIRELGGMMAANLGDMTNALLKLQAEAIEPLRADQPLLDLQHASIASTLEALVHIWRYDIGLDEVSLPSAAEEYARRLAQRGISSAALVRAYRLGQRYVVNWAFDEFQRREPDPEVVLAAGRRLTDFTFRYVDTVAEQLVNVYEIERERWLANRNTVRLAMAEELVTGEQVDTVAAERALGYRLGQHHLGVVVWSSERESAAVELRHLERYVSAIAAAVEADGPYLFLPRDRYTAWGWIPLGHRNQAPEARDLQPGAEHADAALYAAFGTPAAGAAGFRITHLEADRARQVTLAAGPRAQPIISFADPEVRTAAMLAADPEGTRRLVANALGRLAADTEPAGRLRETLLVFLAEQGSYTAAAQRVHLHKNTVKYRIDRAVAERGRSLDEDRLELQLALIACRWLGASVLQTT